MGNKGKEGRAPFLGSTAVADVVTSTTGRTVKPLARLLLFQLKFELLRFRLRAFVALLAEDAQQLPLLETLLMDVPLLLFRLPAAGTIVLTSLYAGWDAEEPPDRPCAETSHTGNTLIPQQGQEEYRNYRTL